jgi:hypothetical protein
MTVRGVVPTVWVLRAVVALGPVVAILAPVPQGYSPSPFVIGVVAFTAVLFAFSPDHVMGGLTMLIVLVWWADVVGAAVPLASVVAAAGLLLSHTAATVLGYGPARAVLDARVVATWARRTAMVWPAALMIWLVADAYTGRASPTSFWLLGLGAALVGALAAAWMIPLSGRRS